MAIKIKVTEKEVHAFITYMLQVEETSTENKTIEQKADFWTKNFCQEKIAKQKKEYAQDVNAQITLSEATTITIPFGKYKYKKVMEVLDIDSDYIDWLLTKLDSSSKIVKAINFLRINNI